MDFEPEKSNTVQKEWQFESMEYKFREGFSKAFSVGLIPFEVSFITDIKGDKFWQKVESC